MAKLKTGMNRFDKLVDGGIEFSSFRWNMKMEGCQHPLEWIPFKITSKGIETAKTRGTV